MTVADLQQHLQDLGRFLSAGKAKSVADELAVVGSALDPFRLQGLKEFAAFLLRADAAARGAPPVTPRGRRASNSGGRAKPDAADLARQVKLLYDRAANPDVTEEQIDAVVTQLSALTNQQLVTTAAGIELTGVSAKAKDAIIDAIRQRILARKGVAIRSKLIDRPAAETP